MRNHTQHPDIYTNEGPGKQTLKRTDDETPSFPPGDIHEQSTETETPKRQLKGDDRQAKRCHETKHGPDPQPAPKLELQKRALRNSRVHSGPVLSHAAQLGTCTERSHRHGPGEQHACHHARFPHTLAPSPTLSDVTMRRAAAGCPSIVLISR